MCSPQMRYVQRTYVLFILENYNRIERFVPSFATVNFRHTGKSREDSKSNVEKHLHGITFSAVVN